MFFVDVVSDVLSLEVQAKLCRLLSAFGTLLAHSVGFEDVILNNRAFLTLLFIGGVVRPHGVELTQL